VTKSIMDAGTEQPASQRGRALIGSAAGQGRIVTAEVWADGVVIDGVHSAELAAAFGADLILMNFVERIWEGDEWNLPILGRFRDLEALSGTVGRPIGVCLEPGDVPQPRRATPWNVQRLVDQGVAMICLAARPGTDVTYGHLGEITGKLRAVVGTDVALCAGMMHHARAIQQPSPADLLMLVEAGADGVLLPLPGTVPGMTRENAVEGVRAVHDAGAIVMGTVGTSPKSSHIDIVAPLALMAREIGVDMHRIGGAYADGAIDPEFLYAYSVAIRGRRHTWQRMVLNARERR
jgi:hypothetical protein